MTILNLAIMCDLQLFEGLKAYKGVDEKIRLFRPDMNCKRLNKSAEYSCLPVSGDVVNNTFIIGCS